jgi:hypothetical protein
MNVLIAPEATEIATDVVRFSRVKRLLPWTVPSQSKEQPFSCTILGNSVFLTFHKRYHTSWRNKTITSIAYMITGIQNVTIEVTRQMICSMSQISLAVTTILHLTY